MTETSVQDTKQRLLEAAINIFGTKGFKAATVREICQEADVNVAAVNYHFGDKDQLYGMALHHMFEHYDLSKDPELAAIAASDAPVEDRLRAHIYAGVLQTYDKDCENCSKCSQKDEETCAPHSLFLLEMAHPTPHLDDIVENFIKPDHIQLLGILRDYFGPNVGDDIITRCEDSIWGQILHRAMCSPIDDRLYGENVRDIDAHALARHICDFTMGGLEYIKQQLETE